MKNKITTFFNGSYRILYILMAIIFGIIIFLTYVLKITGLGATSYIKLIIGVILYISFLIFFYRKLTKLKPKTHDKIAIIITILSFIILIVWGLTHKSLCPHDLSHITDKIAILFNNNTHIVGNYTYFSKYPHQIPLFELIYFVELIGKSLFNAPETTMIIFNCFMIALSFYFVYKIIKELANSRVGLVGLLICALYLDFYMYASYYYTDVMCIPFATIGFYCLIKGEKLEGIKKYSTLILGGILFGIATKIRVVASFLLIGYILRYIYIYIINRKKSDKSIKLIKSILSLAIGFLGIFLLHNILVSQYFKIEINKADSYPLTHYIMMGLNKNTNGGYNSADDSFTYNSQNKLKDTIEVINARIKYTNLNFWLSKLSNNWSNGKHYGYSLYQNVSKIDDTYAFIATDNIAFINVILQTMQLTIYILFFIAIIKELKNKKGNNYISAIIIAMFGGILFYLFWESANRYSFPFLEWLIIVAATSIVDFDKLLSNNKVLTKPYRKILGTIIIVMITIFLVDDCIEYALKVKEIDMTRYSQYSTMTYIETKNNVLKQYFIVDNTFNKINLTINDENIEQKIPYKFELYNMDDTLLYEKRFNTTYKKGVTTISFDFENIIVNEETKFYFKIYSDEATEDNYLKFGSIIPDNCSEQNNNYKNQGIDLLPNGETYLNDQKTGYELTMKIYEHKFSNKMRKKYFLAYSCFIILISYLGIYKIIIKNND